MDGAVLSDGVRMNADKRKGITMRDALISYSLCFIFLLLMPDSDQHLGKKINGSLLLRVI